MLAGLRRSGYTVWWRILDAKHYGIPQHREQIIIVGSARGLEIDMNFPLKYTATT
jgi:DNA (cytosine-5)-methyltransferase 1